MSPLPSVDVVIPTHNRPDFVRMAIESVSSQRYDGPVSIFVVFDREEPDRSLAADTPTPIRVISNARTPGLAGARNSGIVASSADLVAFLDDDDRWLPEKLGRQVAFLQDRPEAAFASTAIRVDFGDHLTERHAGTDAVTHERLLESRMSMLHSSTFLIRRSALLGEIGLVDESAPSSQNEDWELLLRASRLAPIAHLDEPLVAVRWGTTSMFAQAWETRLEAVEWILRIHPDIRTSKIGYARLLGQIAFAHAALGDRRRALRGAAQTAGTRLREPRGYLAALVAAGVPAARIQQILNKRGRGI